MEIGSAHGWIPHLIEENTFSETHESVSRQITLIKPAPFPPSGRLNRRLPRHGMETEEEARVFRHIGEQIFSSPSAHLLEQILNEYMRPQVSRAGGPCSRALIRLERP
jgi:hypothetical protein